MKTALWTKIYVGLFSVTLTATLACGPVMIDTGADSSSTDGTSSPEQGTPGEGNSTGSNPESGSSDETPAAPDEPSAATSPSFETFQQVVQPFMTAFNCSQCHAVGNSYVLVVANSEDDEMENYLSTLCDPRLTSYENPAGKFLSYFCEDATTAKDPGHQMRTATDSQCTDFYAWVTEGEAGTPVACSP